MTASKRFTVEQIVDKLPEAGGVGVTTPALPERPLDDHSGTVPRAPTSTGVRANLVGMNGDAHSLRTSLTQLFEEDPELASCLEASLRTAADRAPRDLDPALVEALDWPRTIDEYADYLAAFARWIPQQSGNAAWTSGSARQRNAEEVSDRLAHFFWLVDQRSEDDAPSAAERSPAFRRWLSDYASSWGSFLDTPESFDDDILESFLRHAPQYTIDESLIDGRPNMPSGWQTFNQFFARELNPGLRPIASPADNTVVACPADCSYEQSFAIGDDSSIPATRVKGTATYGRIPELLEDSPHADAFAGGTFVHYMLPPSAYHRFHTPVAGHVLESRVVQGQVYMQVGVEDGGFASKDRTDTGYEFFQTRGILVLDTSERPEGNLGLVGVVPVGMSHVASVVLSAGAGVGLAKGSEFGYFQFGGSDIILLFQRGVHVDIDTSDAFRHVGTSAAQLTVED